MKELLDNIASIHKEIDVLCRKTNRDVKDITLIAVTKTVAPDVINAAVKSGVTELGENKVQEVMDKYEKISENVNWHLIGHLQTNKVKYIIDKVKLIHSVDRLGLAEEINKRAQKINGIADILIQVNVAREDSKFGVFMEDLDDLIEKASQLEHIRIRGLMTIAPYCDDPEDARPVFRALKHKFDELSKKQIKNGSMKYLSMGMTNDYLVALEEGSNMIRIGTGIFGKRDYLKG